MKKAILTLALVASGLISQQAGAAVNWSLGMTTGDNVTPTPAYGNSRGFSSGALSDSSTVGVTVTAFSATAGANIGGTQAQIDADAGRNTRALETAYLSIYSTNGLGVVNRDGSNTGAVAIGTVTGSDNYEKVSGGYEHSMDNQGRSDVMLLTFTEKVALQSLKLGWSNIDSDVFVLAWSGAAAPPLLDNGSTTFASIAADTFNDPANGWRLINSLSNVVTNTNAAFNSGGAVSSSYWLIGTGGFNSAATGGGVTSGDSDGAGGWKAFGATTGANYDYVKLAGVGGSKAEPNQSIVVPEPGSLALASVALVALIRVRRRKQVA